MGMGMAMLFVVSGGCESSLITCEKSADCPAHASTCSEGICITQISIDNDTDGNNDGNNDSDVVNPDVPDTDNDTSDADVPLDNGCGGSVEFPEGQRPGDPCGENDEGMWECAGQNAVQCNAPNRNACGGEQELNDVPGTMCGDVCRDGSLRCDEDGENLFCAGENEPSNWYLDLDEDEYGAGDPAEFCPSQERGAYTATVGGDCNDTDPDVHPDATEICDGMDNNCNGDSDEPLNACGSCQVLRGEPGTTCGEGLDCGSGTWECMGGNVQCTPGENSDLNACGGCSTLSHEPEEACGQCGAYACDGENATMCVGAEPNNVCGGCNALSSDVGAPCGACGEYICNGRDAVQCSDPGRNACNGCGVLAHQPATSCDECGTYTCNGPNTVTCSNDVGFNACGVCDRNGGVCCGTTLCPQSPQGWPATCNEKDHCEYAPADELEFYKTVIYVPPGSFLMGGPEGIENEKPVHEVTFVQGYFIAKFETTSEWYEQCPPCLEQQRSIANGNVGNWGLNTSSNGRSLHPVNGVNKNDATTFCLWAEGRLPTEAEWEFAATGENHRIYPWGDVNGTCNQAILTICGSLGTTEVGTAAGGVTPKGCLDMIGNVAEHVSDAYHPTYEGAPNDGTSWDEGGEPGTIVIRGGGYHQDTPRISHRVSSFSDERNAMTGFRCVFFGLP